MQKPISSILLLSLALLAACDKQTADKSANKVAEVTASLSTTMASAAEQARKEIANDNMSLGDNEGTAKGEITPQGDLLISGKPVIVTAQQRQLLVKHRELLVNIAIQGVEIGMQGANLASKAVGESIKGALTGNTDQVEKNVEAEAKKIEASAKVLCDQLPLLLESQKKLADAVPEFKPYAKMTVGDIDDCHGEVIERK